MTQAQNRTLPVRCMTITEATGLAEVLRAAQCNKYVARLIDDHVHHGTARSIGDINGNFAGARDDVRDCYLRVTLSTGIEAFWPVADLINEVGEGIFVPDYQR